MNVDAWLTFVVSYTVLSLVPGPSVLMVVSQALANGPRAAFVSILGELVGGLVIITLSLFGVGAILAASSIGFQVIKWVGVTYMAFLGFSKILSAHASEATGNKEPAAQNAMPSFHAGFLTALFNPKAIVFYLAFLSQFLDSTRSLFRQLTVVVLSSTVIVASVLSGYGLLAVQARRVFSSDKAHQRFGYVGGGCLLGGSAFMAATR